LRHINVDGSGEEELLPAISGLRTFVPTSSDLPAGVLYGMPFRGIASISVDGSSYAEILSGPPHQLNPLNVAVDISGGKLYWVEMHRLRRSNLDGSGIEDLVLGSMNAGLALDLSRGKMYWSQGDETGQHIRRANLDGSSIENLVDGTGSISGMGNDITLDTRRQRLYWSSFSRLYSSDLDGDYPASEILIVSGGINGIEFVPSEDGDAVAEAIDNCPADYNPGQQNEDGDLAGDACDLCPSTANGAATDAKGCSAVQVDANGDGLCDEGAPSRGLYPGCVLNLSVGGTLGLPGGSAGAPLTGSQGSATWSLVLPAAALLAALAATVGLAGRRIRAARGRSCRRRGCC
jgi:hypothetical protein